MLDTRSGPGLGTVDALYAGGGARPAWSTLALTVAGRGGVPADASAVSLNVTVTNPQGPGYVTVFPCGTAPPSTSNLNYIEAQTVANAVLTDIGTAGQVCLFTNDTTDVVVDVNGSFPSASSFGALSPSRLLETRSGPGLSTVDGLFAGGGPRPAWSVLALTVAGRGGVPADASAVSLNVTVTNPQGAGYLTVFPCGTAPPSTSNLNYIEAQTVANAVLTDIGTSGQVCLFTNDTTDVVVDVNGSFPA